MEVLGSLHNGPAPSDFRRRIKFVLVLILVAVSILVARLWYLQVIKGDELKQRSESNSVRFRQVPPMRGLIMDRTGRILVDNRPSFDVVYMPDRATQHHQVLDRIRLIYQMKSLDLPSDLNLPRVVRPYQPIRLEKNVGLEKVALIETNALDLKGVYVDVTPVRLYVDNERIAPIVGYTGEISREELEKFPDSYSSGDVIGKAGLERVLDHYIRGRRGAELVEVNVHGKEIKNMGSIAPVPGSNVTLTMDAHLQNAAWDAFEGRAGAAIVMDPRDGSILAMVSSPSYDPNLFNIGIPFDEWQRLQNHPLNPLSNRAISGQYPPGSTYKLIVAAAALEEGVVTPDTKIFCPGSYELGNRTYRCWRREGHGYSDLHRALVVSCDVYFYQVGRMLGVDKIAQYARKFGLGQLSGIDLLHERRGLVPTREWKQQRLGEAWLLGETISISIGQGYNLTTPLQLANAYAALANGGTLWRPRLVQSIESPDGKILKVFRPEKIGDLDISPQTMAILSKAMWGAVNETGATGRAAARPGADVCGKTGTSQVIGIPQNEQARAERKIASYHKDHALFVGFAPLHQPEIVVAVLAENAGSGGAVAAPIARKILDAYFDHPGKTVIAAEGSEASAVRQSTR